MNVSISKSDFSTICRICLYQKRNMFIINLNISQLLHDCLNIKIINGDGLPESICDNCNEKLHQFYEFKQQCEKATDLLYEVATAENDENNSVNNNCDQNNLHSDVESTGCISEKVDSDDSEIVNDPASEIVRANRTEVNDEDSETPNARRVKKALRLGPEKCDLTTLTCRICNKVLVNKYSLARHMETHETDRQFSHTCGVCGKGFYERGHLTKHARRHRGETRYTCEVCCKPFYELSALAVHMRRHKPEPLTCSTCKKTFLVRLQLEMHEKAHEQAQKGHSCSQCGKTFRQLHRLRAHMLSHSERRAWPCLRCDKAFKAEAALRSHVRRIHGSVPPRRNVCPICGKAVAHLRAHLLRHASPNAFACPACPRAFPTSALLAAHERARHGSTPQAPPRFLCASCGQPCRSRAELRVHARKHTDERPYACRLCDKKYKTANGLTTHTRSHTGERPYICSVCFKGFYTSQILKHHLRTHTGERPYVCQLCGRAFTQSSALRTHMSIH